MDRCLLSLRSSGAVAQHPGRNPHHLGTIAFEQRRISDRQWLFKIVSVNPVKTCNQGEIVGLETRSSSRFKFCSRRVVARGDEMEESAQDRGEALRGESKAN